MLCRVSLVPTAGDDEGAVAYGLDHGPYELVFLRVARGGRLPGGAVDDEPVVARVHEVGGELLGAERGRVRRPW